MHEINKVSYSAYSSWKICPYKWKLTYIDKVPRSEGNIHTIFGTCMHEVLQTYIKDLYEKGFEVADQHNLYFEFKDLILKYLKEKKEIKYTKEELFDFVLDAKDILDYFSVTSNRMKLFPNGKYELIGIEKNISHNLKGKLFFNGFYDLILKEKGSDLFKIIDFKTSTKGWSKYEKNQPTKINQLLLYKKFFSEELKIPLENISVEFIILKRKLNNEFIQKRIEIFKPVQGKVSLNNAYKDFELFLNYCFDENGDINLNKEYPKVPKNGKLNNCLFCDFYGKYCDGGI